MALADNQKDKIVKIQQLGHFLDKTDARYIREDKIGNGLTKSEDGVMCVVTGPGLSIDVDGDHTPIPNSIYLYLSNDNDNGLLYGANDGLSQSAASANNGGYMSSAYAAKLDAIQENANNYVLPVAGKTSLGGVKVNSNNGLCLNSDNELELNFEFKENYPQESYDSITPVFFPNSTAPSIAISTDDFKTVTESNGSYYTILHVSDDIARKSDLPTYAEDSDIKALFE